MYQPIEVIEDDSVGYFGQESASILDFDDKHDNSL